MALDPIHRVVNHSLCSRRAAMAALAALLPLGSARADTFPARPLRLIVPTPAGRPFDVQHFHRSRLSILKGRAGFRVYQGRAFFAMDETTGNLWITDLPR